MCRYKPQNIPLPVRRISFHIFAIFKIPRVKLRDNCFLPRNVFQKGKLSFHSTFNCTKLPHLATPSLTIGKPTFVLLVPASVRKVRRETCDFQRRFCQISGTINKFSMASRRWRFNTLAKLTLLTRFPTQRVTNF